jgi:hypothetical protein
MRDEARKVIAIELAARKIELLEGFQSALDKEYRRLRESARANWERLFPCKDPSDACVSIRIRNADPKNRRVSSSGFLDTQKQSRPEIPMFRLARGEAK